MFYETKWLLRRCFGPRGLKKPQKVMNCQQKSRFSLFPRAFKNRDPKSYKKSSPGGQNEPQELLRRSQERPKRPQDGPKSRQERPKRRPRAARSAPKGHQERPWASKVRQEASGDAPGAHFGVILGGPGLHFQAFYASFSKSPGLEPGISGYTLATGVLTPRPLALCRAFVQMLSQVSTKL